MKKQLFLFLCTLLSMLAGVQKVQAYTVENLVEDGWTLVNSESVTGVADNFYVLVDAYSSAYVMSAQADHFRPCYKTINSPLENPSFVWSLEGSDNSFKLKSAGTGAYIKQASGWNTSVGYPRDGRGVVTCTFTLNGGKYDLKCIESNAMVGHWNDGTSGVAEDGENIAANKSAEHADGFFLYAKPKADYIAALAAARKEAAAGASKESPVEVTSWIQNADFSGDWGGWECTLSSSGNMQWGQKTLESWNAGNVVVKQVLSGVPDGLYRLSADLISGNNDNKTAYVFAIGAGEVKSDPVSAVASAGNYNTMSAEVAGNTLTADDIVVTNGVLTVGFNQPSGWIVADNFKLYYMGEDMSIYVEAYHNALTTAQGVDQTAPMNGEALAALQSALSTYASVDETSKDALLAATSALGNAASDATNSAAVYAKAASAIATAEAMQVNNNFVTPAAATTFADAIAAIKTPYTSRTLANEEAENAGTSLGVVAVGWHAAATNTPASNYMISTWPANITVNDWSVEGADDGSNYLVPFFQDWIGDGESLAAKTWTATLTGLESGIYTVSAWVRVRAKNGATAADATGITMDVNGGGEGEFAPVDVTQGTQVGESQFQLATYEAVGKVLDGTLTLNFNVVDGNNISWLSFKDVKYVRTGDIDPADYRAAVAARLETAQGLVNEVMNADVDADLNAKIAATAGYEESTDIDALEQMANDLDVAIAAAQTSVANYQEAAAIINAASILDEAGQAVYNSNNKVLEVKAAYDAKTLVAVTDEQKADCRAALATAARAQTTYGADWSPVIANNDFEGNYVSQYQPKSDRDIYQPEGWTVVWENGDENDMTSLNSTCTSWNQFENMPQPENGGNNVYWARYRWGSTSSLTLKQTINLPAGSYELGAEGCLTNATDGNATLSVKFGDEVAQINFTDAAWTKKTVNFSINEAQDVEILYNFTESKVVEIKAGVDNFTLKALYDAAWQAQIAAAQALAADDDAVAVGKLRDAIEDAIIIIVPTAEEKAALQAAVNQFNLDNADQESDQTAKVATNGWKKFDGSAAGVCATQFAPAIDTYDGRTNVNLAESYEESTAEGTAVTRLGTIIYQDITGLKNGSYKVGFYGNAFFTEGRGGMTSPMADGATDVAYVFANNEKAFITAHIATSTTENNFKEFDVEVTDGTIRLGMGKEKAGTNWHTMQIYQLTWFTSAKALYALDKADMEAAILLAGTLYEDPYKTNGKEELQQAIAEANAARISNHLNIAEFEAEIAKLNDAIKAYKEANYVALSGTYYVKNAAGKFMAAGHNWGTRGIVNETGLDLTLTPNNENKVAIDSRVYNGNNHFLGSNLYMDSGSFAWVIEQVGAEEYSISNGTQYVGVDANDNLVLVDEPAAWQFVPADDVFAARVAALDAATADNGVSATFYMQNPNFNRNDQRVAGWNVSEDCTNKNLNGGNNVNNCAESYHSTFTIKQVISGAPAGVYKLEAQGFYRQDDGAEEATPVFFIGDATADVLVKTGTEGSMSDASESFTNGLYNIEPLEFVYDGEGDLEVGVKATGAHQWVIFDNFRLTYFGAAPAPKTDYTDYIVNADLTGTDPKGFDDAGTKGINGSGIVKCGNNAQFDFKQTISLPAGKYKLEAQAAYRFSGSEQDEYDAMLGNQATKFASLYATIGENTVSTFVQNRYDGASDEDYAAGSGSTVVNGKYVPNSSDAVQAWFNAGQYVNEVTFNLNADGDVTIGIAKDAQPAAGDYTVIGGWTLTRLGDAQPEYAITVAPAENGNVVADKVTAATGETVKVTATPDEGYMVDYGYYVYNETQYDFESIDMEHNIATFTMPAGPVSVVLAFKQAKVAYQFVPSEWGAGDAGRISPENVVADDAAGTITVNKSGANNVCLLFRSAKTYEVKAEQRYFVIKATGLSTAEAASYLWWLNNTNDGSQIVPTSIFEENGQTVFAWDCVTIPIGGKLGIEDTEFTDQGGWSTTFGMTLADANVPAVISYIGFQETIPEPVEEEAYEFVPSEWGAGDAGRISPENVVADDDMGTITVDKTGDNNVCLLFKTNKLYYVENVDYFVIKAKGVSTETGASYLWWLNGKNDNGAQFAPTSTATETDGTIILEWKISECGNIGENINPVGKSYLLGGEGWTTTFGLTQADALTPVVISYIGYGTKSATAISAAKSQDAEGALKDGKYLIKGEIVIVKNGKLYKANGQLK